MPSIFAMMAVAALAVTQAPAAASTIDGTWRSPDGRNGAYLHVRVQPCRGGDDARCAVVTGAFQGARHEAVGRQVMQDMEPRSDGTWQGKVIQPLKGHVYKSRIRPAGDGAMIVEGCILGMLVCREQEWTRVN